MVSIINIPEKGNLTAIDIATFRITLKQPIFTLKDIGITNKIFHDWRKMDIVPMGLIKKDGEGYRDIKLNFYEWLWCLIIKDLRLLGINYKNLKTLRDNCWQEIPDELIMRGFVDKALQKEFEDQHSDIGPAINEVIEFGNTHSKEQLAEALKEIQFKMHWIEILITTCLIQKEDIRLLLRHDGEFLVFRPEEQSILNKERKISISEDYLMNFALYPHCSVSLLGYANTIFKNQDYIQYLPKLGFINSDELEVLQMIRQGGINELVIKLDKKSKISGYEFTRAKDISVEDMENIMKTFFLKKYESVSFKWKDHKTVYFERIKRKQLK